MSKQVEKTHPKDEPARKWLPTDRAVFQPRSSEVQSQPSRVASQPSISDGNESPDGIRHLSSLFVLHREGLIAVLPERRMDVMRLSDGEIERITIETTQALTEIYAIILRAVCQAYLLEQSRRR